MRKIATLTAAALLASAGTYALAQAPAAPAAPTAPAQEQARPEPRRMSQDDYNRLVDARVAAIKAGLKLSADQERLWAPVETAIRSGAADRFDRFEQRRTTRERRQSMDFMQRLEMRGTMMTENAQRASTLATAMRPLWDTFSEDQKRIAPRLVRSAMAGERMGRRERGGHGRMGAMMHHGHGMMGRGGPQAPAPQQQ